MVETKDKGILKRKSEMQAILKRKLELQAEPFTQRSELKQIIENQNKIIRLLEQNNRQFVYLKRKKNLKRIIYLSILIFIFSYYDIFQLAINFLGYYYYFLDLIDKISSIIQNTDTIQNNLSLILQKQKQILNLTVQNTDKVFSPETFSTPKTLKLGSLKLW